MTYVTVAVLVHGCHQGDTQIVIVFGHVT